MCASNSQYTRVCGTEFASVVLPGAGTHKYTPASSGRTGSMVHVVTGPTDSVERRSESIWSLANSPSMSKKRNAWFDDAVHLTINSSPGVTLFADSSKTMGTG